MCIALFCDCSPPNYKFCAVNNTVRVGICAKATNSSIGVVCVCIVSVGVRRSNPVAERDNFATKALAALDAGATKRHRYQSRPKFRRSAVSAPYKCTSVHAKSAAIQVGRSRTTCMLVCICRNRDAGGPVAASSANMVGVLSLHGGGRYWGRCYCMDTPRCRIACAAIRSPRQHSSVGCKSDTASHIRAHEQCKSRQP